MKFTKHLVTLFILFISFSNFTTPAYAMRTLEQWQAGAHDGEAQWLNSVAYSPEATVLANKKYPHVSVERRADTLNRDVFVFNAPDGNGHGFIAVQLNGQMSFETNTGGGSGLSDITHTTHVVDTPYASKLFTVKQAIGDYDIDPLQGNYQDNLTSKADGKFYIPVLCDHPSKSEYRSVAAFEPNKPVEKADQAPIRFVYKCGVSAGTQNNVADIISSSTDIPTVNSTMKNADSPEGIDTTVVAVSGTQTVDMYLKGKIKSNSSALPGILPYNLQTVHIEKVTGENVELVDAQKNERGPYSESKSTPYYPTNAQGDFTIHLKTKANSSGHFVITDGWHFPLRAIQWKTKAAQDTVEVTNATVNAHNNGIENTAPADLTRDSNLNSIINVGDQPAYPTTSTHSDFSVNLDVKNFIPPISTSHFMPGTTSGNIATGEVTFTRSYVPINFHVEKQTIACNSSTPTSEDLVSPASTEQMSRINIPINQYEQAKITATSSGKVVGKYTLNGPGISHKSEEQINSLKAKMCQSSFQAVAQKNQGVVAGDNSKIRVIQGKTETFDLKGSATTNDKSVTLPFSQKSFQARISPDSRLKIGAGNTPPELLGSSPVNLTTGLIGDTSIQVSCPTLNPGENYSENLHIFDGDQKVIQTWPVECKPTLLDMVITSKTASMQNGKPTLTVDNNPQKPAINFTYGIPGSFALTFIDLNGNSVSGEVSITNNSNESNFKFSGSSWDKATATTNQQGEALFQGMKDYGLNSSRSSPLTVTDSLGQTHQIFTSGAF